MNASPVRIPLAWLVAVVIGTACVSNRPGSGAATAASANLPSASPPASLALSSAIPSTAPLTADAATALAAATAFETARADSQWQTAWDSLSDFSRARIGTLAAFERLESAYNLAGGSTFEIADPTQDPDLLSADLLGNPYADAAAHADITRAWLVSIKHPKVKAASAGTTALLVAPIGDRWVVWIVH